MAVNYGIYKRNCEDGELCCNSEENCQDEVEELQNKNAGKQVSLCNGVLSVLFLALTLQYIFI